MPTKKTSLRTMVKYKNELNTYQFRDFKPAEFDLFFAIAAQVRDKGVEEVTLTFDQLKGLTGYKRSSERLVSDLESTYAKLLQMSAKTDDGDAITYFNLFNQFRIVRSQRTVTIAVNSEFKSLFNELESWTIFGLEQFVSLSSAYSKTMFRLVKQYRTTGIRRFTVPEFRDLLDVPASYQNSHIQARVVKVINRELPTVIPGFKLEAIRQAQLYHQDAKVPKRGRGSAIVAYVATWTKEQAKQRPRPKDVTPQTRTKTQRKRKEALPQWAKQDPTPQGQPSKESVKRIEELLADLRQN